jgi:hypothetical protein
MKFPDLLKSQFKLLLVVLIFALFLLSFLSNKVFAITPCPTPAPSTTLSLEAKENCITNELEFNKVTLFDFFPKFGSDDAIGTVSTILLAILVILSGGRTLIACYKWARNDPQDKLKKEALKKIREGILVIFIGFSAYAVVLFLKPLFYGDAPLINCANLYFKDNETFVRNTIATDLNGATDEFKACIKLVGKTNILNSPSTISGTSVTNKYKELTYKVTSKALATSCISKGYADFNPSLVVYDRQSLNKCFADVLKNL